MQLYKYLPLPSDRMGTLWSLVSIKDACIIEYGPAGTTHYGIEGYMQFNSDLRAKLYTTHMDEGDIVMGETLRLEETIKEVDLIYNPKAIFVVASSVSSIIGTDLDNVCENIKDEVKASLITFTGGGFRGDYTLGIREVLTALTKYVVKEPQQKAPNSFNIIGSNIDCFNFLSDINEIKTIMNSCFNYNLNAVFTANSTFDEIESASSSALNIVLRSEGLDCAHILKEKYGIPFIEGAPYGLKNTVEWVTRIEHVLSVKANEEYLKGQTERTRKNLIKFKHIIMSYKKLSTVLAGNYDFITDISPFLRDELSLQVEKAFVNHNVNVKNYRNTPDEIKNIIVINPTETNRENYIAKIKPHLVIGDAITLDIAINAPLKLQVSNPNLYRINIYENTPFMGFNGVNYIIELLLNQISKNGNKLEGRF